MAAKFLRRLTWWARFYHPRTGKLLRESLGTHDEARAELLRQRVELEAALLHPRFQAADLPSAVRKLVQVGHAEPAKLEPSAPAPTKEAPPPAIVAASEASINDALRAC